MNRKLFGEGNYSAQVEHTNRKLLAEGKPYHYDASGCTWCNVCNAHWDATPDPDWKPCKHNKEEA